MAAAVPTPPAQPLRLITELRDNDDCALSPRRRKSALSRKEFVDRYEAVSPFSTPPPCPDSQPLSRSTSLAFNFEVFRTRRVVPLQAMARSSQNSEEQEALMRDGESSTTTPCSRPSMDSLSSASTTSLVLENLNSIPLVSKPPQPMEYRDDDSDPELPRFERRNHPVVGNRMSKHLKRIIWIVSVVGCVGWALALAMFIFSGRYKHSSTLQYDHENPMQSSGKKVTLESVQHGAWSVNYASVQWVPGANGEDGLLLDIGQPGKDHLVVEDIRSRNSDPSAYATKTLMKTGWITIEGQDVWAEGQWVSPDMKHVLIAAKKEKTFRHSYTALYYILNVETQQAQALDPIHPTERIQLAQWSPSSDSVVFTRNNNIYLRMLSSTAVREITKDGGPEYFYGIPDWTYEEEVFANNIATWWARDGNYVAFLRTNETAVPEYPVQYFLSRPSGKIPDEGLANYPEVRQIKYPKAGAPNPVVDMLFYDVSRNEMFSVDIKGGFPDDDRLVTNVLWADNGKVLIQESNRESDHIRYVLVDVVSRSGKTVRTVDLTAADGGWVEPAQRATYVPADPENGRPSDGYIDTTVYQNNDHLAYYTPLDNDKPIMLTSGDWEVDMGPSAVDLKHNLVYFVSTIVDPGQRHLFSVKLDGSDMKALVPTDKAAYWAPAFSSGSGYIYLANMGPGIPYQKVVSTPAKGDKLDIMMEDNKALAKQAASHELPHVVFSKVSIDNYSLPVMERRPAHFDPSKKYPVLFYLYGGPNSQTVNRKFHIDFQSYITSSLEYIVVTVDGRGTGFIGREARTIIREHLGRYEAHDQIETAKIWAQKPYVDADRMAIWGWSYGGFMTLKVLEMDAGQTFKYGMAVAPVTDWRFYDSIYTERYMRMPQNNKAGYDEAAITNVTAMSQNVRFLIMHGVSDDNVHMQNTLTLLDKFDLKGIENYDVHVFPDSDHSIYFHNANKIVYDKLSKWLINAFNGEWYRTEDPVPEWKK